MNVKPLGERVLIKVKAAEEKTSGGLIIPQASQEKTQEGTVTAIGESDKITVKVGDNVMYDKYAGTSFKINGEDYLIIKAEEILAVIG
ncbi:MAG: co-chaperone GroES [Spirochaetales bacterium]|jgi:chaperonin GroES|nr:co-chaperone GroES [Spirochaetales bacterium]MBQ2124385.1 co-chaperone GroES [Spirochaetales bacterium]